MNAAKPLASLFVAILFVPVAVSAQEPQVSLQLLEKFEVPETGDNLGYAVAFVGDVDSDGASDILLGAPGASPGGLTGAGSVFLYSGRTFSLIHRFDGQSEWEDFGVSVAGIDDLNGDSIPDILIGADGADPGGRTSAGSVYVYSGGSPFGRIRPLDGEAADDFFGTSVTSLGNIIGDGRPEFAVGAIGVDPDAQRTDAGRVYVYNGNFTLLTRLNGFAARDGFGISVAGLGDVSGDSIPDILVGADLTNPSNPQRINAGSAYLFSGQSFALLQRFEGEVPGDFFGSSVAGVGDVNGDSRPDFLIGAPGADPANITEAGSAYLFSGTTNALLQRFNGTSAGDDFGWRVAAGGDIDGDGFADVIIAADFADPSGIADAGRVYLYSGRDYSFLGQVNGEAEGDNMGSSVAGAADTDGDGMPNLLVGAPYNSPNGIFEAGGAYLYKMTPIPVARFSFNPSKPDIGQLVTFDGSTSTSPNGPIVSYSWTFGDGGTETGTVVSHTYATPGNYTVSLTITDSTSVTAVKTRTIAVNPTNQPPTASFIFAPSRPFAGSSVTFDATSSQDSDGTIISYTWNFGDGSPIVAEIDPIAVHTYDTAGQFTVRLDVEDDDGATSSASLDITVAATNQPPIGRFSYSPSSPLAGQMVSLDASTSSDPDGTIVSYSWNMGDGSTRNGVTTTHTYPVAGDYQVTLTVTDDSGGTNSTSRLVQVLPALTVAASSNTTRGTAPLSVSFTALASGGASPYSYDWDFGDGQGSLEQSASHQYSSPGSYQARVTVTDSLGNTASDTITITAVSPALTVTASSSTTVGDAPLTVQFTAEASGGQEPYTFLWDFGDGQTSSGPSATHQYSLPDTYEAFVTVTDYTGDTASQTITITVVAVTFGLTVKVSSDPAGGIGPLKVQFTAEASGGHGSYTFLWEFGDGQTASGSSTAHTYNAPGSYDVRVRVQDSGGNTATDTMRVTVVETPPPRVGPLPADYLVYSLSGVIAALTAVALGLYMKRRRLDETPAA